jgi:hypothetical protein
VLPTRRGLTVIEGGRSPQAAEADRTGRIVHDPRGNAVWDWAMDTGVLAKATITDLLETLTPQPLTLELETPAPTAWAGDPYNRHRRDR